MTIDFQLTPKQKTFIETDAFEVLYGGAAGGGKTFVQALDALLYALKYQGSRQLILRRTYTELNRSMVPQTMAIYPAKIAKYNASDHVWKIGRSIIELGYIATEKDVTNYQSAEYDVIRFDEMTHFTETQYTYMFSRVRGTNRFPKHLKCTANPGSVGHANAKARFIDIGPPMKVHQFEDGSRLFIPAKLEDNPFLMKADPDYEKRMRNLPDEVYNRSQQEVETAINTIPGLTQYQKAYIWQSANKEWKKNPFGSATVTEYQSGMETAINPVANGTQTSPFGPREQPTAGASTFHDGLDIGASEGEPIKAILSGKVIAKDYDYGGGYYVKIDHGNGRVSTYMHMQKGSTDNINVGDEVSQGQQIGAVGSTGEYSTGPHLDIRITQDGKYVDPLTVIPGYGVGPSGYVSSNSAAASTISSGVSAAQNEKASSSSKKTGLDTLDTYKSLKSLWM